MLDGGLKKWKLENRTTTNKINKVNKTKYIALEKKEMIKNKKQIDENITNKKFKVIDARSKRWFEGKDPEQRKDVRSGEIKNSYFEVTNGLGFNFWLNSNLFLWL